MVLNLRLFRSRRSPQWAGMFRVLLVMTLLVSQASASAQRTPRMPPPRRTVKPAFNRAASQKPPKRAIKPAFNRAANPKPPPRGGSGPPSGWLKNAFNKAARKPARKQDQPKPRLVPKGAPPPSPSRGGGRFQALTATAGRRSQAPQAKAASKPKSPQSLRSLFNKAAKRPMQSSFRAATGKPVKPSGAGKAGAAPKPPAGPRLTSLFSRASKPRIGQPGDKALASRGVKPAPGTRVWPKNLPRNWRVGPGKKGKGEVRYTDPKNKRNTVRVKQGTPGHDHTSSRGPHVRWSGQGGTLDANGRRLKTKKSDAAHIKLSSFKYTSRLTPSLGHLFRAAKRKRSMKP